MPVETAPENEQGNAYLFDTGSDLGREQMADLEQLLDGHTTRHLEEVGVRAGQRCLELGAGGGSIARRLADRVAPSGTVVAVDLDTSRIAEHPGVEIHRHDINAGLPVRGPFDLIHARLLLVHLADRLRILRMLVDALAPGGWLVLGENITRTRPVLAAPSRADEELFTRVQDVSHGMARGRGVALDWGSEVDGRMAEAGLVNIHSTQYVESGLGGEPMCRLHRNYNLQAERPLLDAGLTRDELERYRGLLLDPRFRTSFYPFVVIRGQRPAA